jgi:Crinkler effector protein N-terminal domain
VHELKKAIKDEIKIGLDALAASALTLYKINVNASDDDDDEQKYINEVQSISQDLSNREKAEKLNPIFNLSKYFKESDLPEETIHVLVQLPDQGESIDPRACGTVTETRRSWFYAKTRTNGVHQQSGV